MIGWVWVLPHPLAIDGNYVDSGWPGLHQSSHFRETDSVSRDSRKYYEKMQKKKKRSRCHGHPYMGTLPLPEK